MAVPKAKMYIHTGLEFPKGFLCSVLVLGVTSFPELRGQTNMAAMMSILQMGSCVPSFT